MKKVTESVKIENKKPPIFILILLIFIIIVLYFIYNIGLRFEPVANIEYEGYAVSGKDLVENLLRSDLNAEEYIDAIKIVEDSAIYKRIATYFVGEDKKIEINLDYPIYINQNIALLNMAENTKFITTNFEEIEGYKNSTLTAGGLYNAEGLERADYNDYLFLKNSDNMFINSKKFEIKTVANTYIIPANSIINITEKYIAYYQLENGVFKYKNIIDLDMESKVLIETLNHAPNFEKGDVETSSQINEYTYKEFLIKLNIIKEIVATETTEIIEEKQDKEESKDEEDDKEDTINNNENNTNNEPGEQPQIKWQKPEVTCTEFEANVYTASTVLRIYDPSGAIKTAITFEIYKDGKVYMRSQAISSGTLRIGILEPNTEYEIKGTYRYSTEDGKTIQVEFINQMIKTKDITELEPLTLSFENGEIYSNKIELINFKIDSDFNLVSETIAGVKNAEILINDKRHDIKLSDLRKLLSAQTIKYQSSNTLESNQKINFEIKFYDIVNNEVKLENNFGKTQTCMQKPEMTIEPIDSDAGIDISLKTKYINPDNVEIKNVRYVVYSVNNEIVDEGIVTSNIIKPNNLELSKYYTIKTYGDYDINDSHGETKNNLLGELSFTTSSIDSFGGLYIDVSIVQEEIKSDSVIINFNINATKNKTNLELIKMLKNVSVSILDDDKVVQKIYLEKQEFSTLVNLGIVNLLVDNLDSDTKYNIEINGLVQLGKTSKELTAEINGPKSFYTLKEEVKINIKNLFVLNNMIDFDINIYDEDGAIRANDVELTLYSTRNEEIYTETITFSENSNEYKRIQITNLLENELYYLSVVAQRYSVRQEESTIKPKSFEFSGDEKRIVNEKLNEENVGAIYTNSVSGDISLENLERKATSENKNLIDVESEVNWYSEVFNTKKGYLKEYSNETLTLGVGNGQEELNIDIDGDTRADNIQRQIYLFDLKSSLPAYNGEELDISFKYKKSDDNLKIYLQNGTNLTNDRILEVNYENSNMMEEENWYTFTSNEQVMITNQYIGFLLEGLANSAIEIKDLQVRIKEIEDNTTAGDEEINEYTPYLYNFVSKFNFNLNLYDMAYNENVTNGCYYIKIENIEDEKDLKYIEYLDENDYNSKASGDNGENNNAIENIFIEDLKLAENQRYRISLLLKNPNVPEREYVLKTIEVDTNYKEIKSISNIDEYMLIQPNGSYIFTNNITFDNNNDYKFGNENLYFNGCLDFNGRTISRDIVYRTDTYKYYLFYGLSGNAYMKNLVFDLNIDLKNEEGSTNVAISEQNAAILYKNEGTINDIIVNLNGCSKSPIKEFAVIGYENTGTLREFVIYLNNDFYLGGNGALGFVTSNGGTIKNGYISSYSNENEYAIIPTQCYSQNINIAGLVSSVSQTEISNIYSLVNINSVDDMDNVGATFNAGNIISKVTDSTVKNIYSVGIGNITKTYKESKNIGPTIAYLHDTDDNNYIYNSYFFCEEESDNNNYNTKVNIAALSNAEFQAGVLNSEDSDKKFIINDTVKKYFPHIELSEVMPEQSRIDMKTTKATEADILLVKEIDNEHTKKLVNKDTEKIVEFTIYNPEGARIEDINIVGLEVDKYRIHSDDFCKTEKPEEDCDSINGTTIEPYSYCLDEDGNKIEGYTQRLDGKTTTLIAKVTIPIETNEQNYKDDNGFDNRQYTSTYQIKSIKAEGHEEKVYAEDDGTVNIVNEINLTYYYHIKDIETGWKRINSYPDQNYRIVNDLDFSNSAEYCITNAFTGILDGKYIDKENKEKIASLNNIGKISGTEISKPLFYKINNTQISNLMINGYSQIISHANVTEVAWIGRIYRCYH